MLTQLIGVRKMSDFLFFVSLKPLFWKVGISSDIWTTGEMKYNMKYIVALYNSENN